MRIILADHHAEPRLALKTLLEEQPEFDLAGEVEDAQSLLGLVEGHTADLILLDYKLPGIPINDLIASLCEIKPDLIVVVMSSETERSRALLKAGADAFVSKTDEPYWLIEMLQKYAETINQKEESNSDEIT
jgi:two-component system response regulator FimZ (fimbrial Z protein)/two-component system response regulator EvgA